mgnify:CR=1 FL=1
MHAKTSRCTPDEHRSPRADHVEPAPHPRESRPPWPSHRRVAVDRAVAELLDARVQRDAESAERHRQDGEHRHHHLERRLPGARRRRWLRRRRRREHAVERGGVERPGRPARGRWAQSSPELALPAPTESKEWYAELRARKHKPLTEEWPAPAANSCRKARLRATSDRVRSLMMH